MGQVITTLGVWAADGTDLQRIEMRVDTGASYSQLPGDMLRDLGWVPNLSSRPADLADGTQTIVELGEVKIRYNDVDLMRVFVFGEGKCPKLLGSDTLQGLGMGVDPVNHRLIDVIAYR